MSSPNIVSGGLSSWSELGHDESFLRDWLKEAPGRLGLGELSVADPDPVKDEDGNPAFIAEDDERYFSVDVRMSEMDPSGGFGLLDNWARNRVRHLDKTHVAVLVTENVGDRYRTTLQTLTEHLPLVVVEIQVWRGENEAIIVPHVALASSEVDLGGTPAEKAAVAAEAVAAQAVAAEAVAAEALTAKIDSEGDAVAEDPNEADAVEDIESAAVESKGDAVDKDDTGVADPWGLPGTEAESTDGAGNGKRLLTKITS